MRPLSFLTSDLILLEGALGRMARRIRLFGSITNSIKRPNDIDILVEVPANAAADALRTLTGLHLSLPVLRVDQNTYYRRTGSSECALGYHVVVVEPEHVQRLMAALTARGGNCVPCRGHSVSVQRPR